MIALYIPKHTHYTSKAGTLFVRYYYYIVIPYILYNSYIHLCHNISIYIYTVIIIATTDQILQYISISIQQVIQQNRLIGTY